MIEKYGLTKIDLARVREKIALQEDYLEQNTFTTSNGEVKSFLDISYSANLSKRYYPRILNKVNTFTSHGLNQGLVPIFLTVTLDGFFRDFLQGDYSRWDKHKRDYILGKHIPNNDRSGHYIDYIERGSTLTPKDLYKIIGWQLHRFTKSTTLQNIRKEGLNYSFLRVTEPHKDGTPHFHILMYAPLEYVPSIYKEFVRYFPAPQNHKKLTLKSSGRHPSKIADGIYETNGFQTKIRSASAYILKYILKSFTNLINDDEIDYLQAWYVHNKIPRLISSHTLVSQDVYHSTAILEDDWYYLTNIKVEGGHTIDRDNNYFKFDDSMGRVITGDNGYFHIFNNGKLVSSYGQHVYRPRVIRLKRLSFSAVRPSSFSPLDRYVIYNAPKKYRFEIAKILNDGSHVVFLNKDDFFISAGVTDFFGFGDIVVPIHSTERQAMHLSKQHPHMKAIIHNGLVYAGVIDAPYLTGDDFYFADAEYDYDDSLVPDSLEVEEVVYELIL